MQHRYNSDPDLSEDQTALELLADEFPGEAFEYDTAEEALEPEWETELRRRRSASRGAPTRRRRAPAPHHLRFRTPRFRPRPPGRRPPHLRPPAVSLRRAAPVSCPTPPSEYLRWVQSTLNRLLGSNLAVTGVAGSATRRALREFQSREGLRVDGIAGPETRRALMRAGTARRRPVSSAREVADELEALEHEQEVNRRSRDYIRWVQRALNRILGLRLAVDGISGRNTRSAVRRFQQRYGRARHLAVDGVVGPQTERALISAGAGAPPGMATPVVPVTPAAGGFVPVPVESPGGGRIRNKTAPGSADLTRVTGTGGRRIALHRHAAAAWQAMVQAARLAGFRSPLLLPTSGFRDPAVQARLWKAALERYGSASEARKWVAPPGGSAHQSGRAIDLYLGGRNSSANVAWLRRQPVYRWLSTNAVRFGFYPYTREPWHWEYNPPART